MTKEKNLNETQQEPVNSNSVSEKPDRKESFSQGCCFASENQRRDHSHNSFLMLMIAATFILAAILVVKETQKTDEIKALQNEMDAYYLIVGDKIDALKLNHESVKVEVEDLSGKVAELEETIRIGLEGFQKESYRTRQYIGLVENQLVKDQALLESRIENLEETNEKMKNVFGGEPKDPEEVEATSIETMSI